MPTKPRTKKPAAKPKRYVRMAVKNGATTVQESDRPDRGFTAKRKTRSISEKPIDALARNIADALGRRLDDLLSVKQESPVTGWDTLVDVGLSAASVYDSPASACARLEPTDRHSPIEEAVGRLLQAVNGAEHLTDMTADRLKDILSPPVPTNGALLGSTDPGGTSELASRLNGIADRIYADGWRRGDILNRLEL